MGMKYKRLGMTISVEITYKDRDYEVWALTNKVNGKGSDEYEVTFMIKDSTIDKLDIIEDITYTISSSDVNTDIHNTITDFFEEGKFDKYLDRYIYENDMLELGINTDEKNCGVA